jgi:hypothetical protein
MDVRVMVVPYWKRVRAIWMLIKDDRGASLTPEGHLAHFDSSVPVVSGGPGSNEVRGRGYKGSKGLRTAEQA